MTSLARAADAPRLVIFDCDGTIVDSQAMIVAAMTRAFMTHGLEPLPREAVLAIVGLSLPEAFARLVPEASAELAAELSAAYKTGFHTLRADPAHHEPPYPGLLETIRTLHARSETLLAIATGKSRRGVAAVLDRLDLGGRFASIQTADTNPSKPSPVMIERALIETGVDAADAVMIGDTVFDVEMAQAAGVRAIGVAWGYHPVSELVSAGASAIVHDGADLLTTIDRTMNW